MKLKIPPALVAAIIAGLMRLTAWYIPLGSLVLPGAYWVAGLLLVTGVLLGMLGLYQFYQEGTTIDASILQNVLNLLLLPLFIWYMNRYQIIPEEEVMEEKFGDAYLEYKSEVSRWF